MTVEEIQQLKELFQDIVCAKVNSVEKLMDEKIEAIREARILEAKEIARRLDFLNGEAERLDRIQATYVPREVQCKIDEAFRKEIDELKTYRDTQIGKSLALSGTISGVIALLISLLMKLFGG